MILCPLCQKNDQMVYLDGEEYVMNNIPFYGITCDIDEIYCKRCETTFPLCPTCNGYETRYDLDNVITILPDLQILHFIGFAGVEGHNNNIIVHPNGDIAEDTFRYDNVEYVMDDQNNEPIPDEFKSIAIGQYIPYFVFPQPGYNESRAPLDVVIGPDGGYPTYWWCTKCNTVQQYSDK